MKPVSQIPYIFHGGDDDLNHALASLSWKEMAAGFGIVLAIFLLIVLLAVLFQ